MSMNMKNFEQVVKRYNRKLKNNTISIGKNAIYFSHNISENLEKYILVYLNRKDNIIGFKGTDDSLRGFKMVTNKGSSNHIGPKIIMGNLKKGLYTCKIEGDFIVINGAILNKNSKSSKGVTNK